MDATGRDESAAAVMLTAAANGSISLKTTVLMTPEEIDEAAKKSPAYRAPGTLGTEANPVPPSRRAVTVGAQPLAARKPLNTFGQRHRMANAARLGVEDRYLDTVAVQ